MNKETENNFEERILSKIRRSTIQALPKENNPTDKITPNAEIESEIERKEVYAESATRNILSYLLENEGEDIIPTYNCGSGFTYESIEAFFEPDTSQQKIYEFLERLSRLDILKKNFFEAILTCPTCKSTILTMHYRCPKCKSHNMHKTSLTEHIPCGYIAEREKYTHHRCPQCNISLAEGEYRDMGRWFVCKQCGEKFEDAESDIICRKCGKNFKMEEAKVTDIPRFSLNRERKKEVRQSVASLDCVNKLLLDLEFDTQIPGVAIGEKSGMTHNFSLIAKKFYKENENTIAIDHAVAENEVQAAPLILYLYKISEVKVDLPIFIAIPKLSEGAKKIAQGHKILLIEGSVDEEGIEGIKQIIQKRLKEVNQPRIVPEDQPEIIEDKINVIAEKEGKKPQAQLFDVVSTIHPEQQSLNLKDKLNFVKAFKKTVKKDKENPK